MTTAGTATRAVDDCYPSDLDGSAVVPYLTDDTESGFRVGWRDSAGQSTISEPIRGHDLLIALVAGTASDLLDRELDPIDVALLAGLASHWAVYREARYRCAALPLPVDLDALPYMSPKPDVDPEPFIDAPWWHVVAPHDLGMLAGASPQERRTRWGPFGLFSTDPANRVHQIAHLVEAPDAHIFKSDWGFEHFDGVAEGCVGCNAREMGVRYVGERLGLRWALGSLGSSAHSWLGGGQLIRPDLIRAWTGAWIDASQRWDAPRIIAEIERKYAIIRANPEAWERPRRSAHGGQETASAPATLEHGAGLAAR